MTDRRRLDRFTGHCGGGCCTASLARQDGDGAQEHPGTPCGNDHAQDCASPADRLHDSARAKMIERAVGNLAVVCLSSGQAEPYRQSLRVDDDVDLGRKAASGATETMIWALLFPVAACWCARMEVLSIIWISPSYAALMASISRSHTPAFRHRTKRL